MVVAVVPSGSSAAAVTANIQSLASVDQTRYILLVGDCHLDRAADRSDASREVPTHYIAAQVTEPWGTTPTLPGDFPYGDLDGDGVPEAAVGRLPVDSAEQLQAVLQRLAAYEDSRDLGPWRETVQLTAGVGGFGLLADAAIESVTRSMVTSLLPATTKPLITYASAGSPFNPGLHAFHNTVIQRYGEGARFWVYAGHGWVTELDRVPARADGQPVLCCDDVGLLQCDPARAPIAVLFACYTGAFDAREDCLAERMFLAGCGPVAVLSGSRVTMPYGNASAATGLIRAVYEDRPSRLGDAWLQTLQEMARRSEEDAELADRRQLIDTLAKLISPSGTQLASERQEHMHLYNWFGDPTMRLRHAEPLALEVPRAAELGAPLEVRGVAPTAGRLQVSLRRAIGTVPAGTPPERRYEAVNQPEILTRTVEIDRPGPFRVTLQPPTAGLLHVVARLQAAESYASGAARVIVHAGVSPPAR